MINFRFILIPFVSSLSVFPSKNWKRIHKELLALKALLSSVVELTCISQVTWSTSLLQARKQSPREFDELLL